MVGKDQCICYHNVLSASSVEDNDFCNIIRFEGFTTSKKRYQHYRPSYNSTLTRKPHPLLLYLRRIAPQKTPATQISGCFGISRTYLQSPLDLDLPP